VDVIFSPFVRLWNWVDQVGGYPGQVFFVCLVIMVLLGGLTWYGNKR
jgi:Ni,Fe-hydrogenase I cytochrome b subunit